LGGWGEGNPWQAASLLTTDSSLGVLLKERYIAQKDVEEVEREAG
jgi:hypothetical protein